MELVSNNTTRKRASSPGKRAVGWERVQYTCLHQVSTKQVFDTVQCSLLFLLGKPTASVKQPHLDWASRSCPATRQPCNWTSHFISLSFRPFGCKQGS